MITLAITLGDPGGIGPEIALKAVNASQLPERLRLVSIGDRALLRHYAKHLGLPVPKAWLPGKRIDESAVSWDPAISPKRRAWPSWKPGSTGLAQGEASAHWIRCAVEGCLSGLFDGMVTAPICKKSLASARVPFPGHTEYLAHLTRAKSFAMMLMGGTLRVVLVTRHLPISEVASSITGPSIEEAVRLAWDASVWLRAKRRLIGVAALNPHAGEDGMLGREEVNIIAPAIERLKQEGIEVEGPIPADVIFTPAIRKRYAAIVAMYHDQGLGPLKMLSFDRGVNLTLGLPITRASPDHGTAFDIAGKGIASPRSMIEAIKLVAQLAERENPWSNTRSRSQPQSRFKNLS